MECKQCGKESVCDLKHLGSLCSSCFCGVIERRVRKHVKSTYSFFPDQKILFSEKDSREAMVAYYLLERVAESVQIFLEVAAENRGENHLHVDVTTGSKAASDLLAALVQNRPEDLQKNNELQPLIVLSDEEVELFAMCKGFVGKPLEKGKYFELLNKIESQYPASTFMMQKSCKGISTSV